MQPYICFCCGFQGQTVVLQVIPSNQNLCSVCCRDRKRLLNFHWSAVATGLAKNRLDPNAVCGLLYDAMLYQPWDYARQLGVQALHPHFSEPTFVTGEVEAAHRLGLSVNVWTVNEEADLRRMAEMNCDGIISNYPDVALRVLREVRG